jgi:lipopolysaccharide transport system ATP-binding protein
MSQMIVLENLSLIFPRRGRVSKMAKYADRRVLSQISLTVRDGERLGIIGRNGSGKSTLLRVMAGVLRPTSGRIWSQGTLASILSASAGFEKAATGYENIFLRGMLLGMSRSEVKRAVPEILEFSGLGEAINLPLHTYSSGMIVRLAFGICTSIRPNILLFDEWIGVGDAMFIESADERLHSMLDHANIMVLTTHSEPLMKRFCNRAIVIEEGEIVAAGGLDHCWRFYRELIVATRPERVRAFAGESIRHSLEKYGR